MIKKKKGLTLVELIAVMAIMAIIGVVVVSLFGGTNKLLDTARTENVLQDEARLIVESIENDIKTGKNISATLNVSAATITIGTNNYGCSTFYSSEAKSKVVYAFTKKNSSGTDETFAYIKIDKKLVKAKLVGSAFVKVSQLSGNVNDDNAKFITAISGKNVSISFTLTTSQNEKKYNILATQRN